MTTRLLLAFTLAAGIGAPAMAQHGEPRVICDGAPVQGGFLICTSGGPSSPPLAINGGEPHPENDSGFAFFPISRDATGTVEVRGHGLEPWRAEIERRTFDIQRIDGLPPSAVRPRTPEEQAKVAADTALKNQAWTHREPSAWWLDGFRYPLERDMRRSGVYGSQRILNGEPNNPHLGVDYAANTGEPVLSPAAGVVVLAEPDMYFEGGLIVIDHGGGVKGVFMHLSRLDVAAGDLVAAGDRIGAVGATGRATGPHLHWGVRVRGTYVDPELLMAFNPRESQMLWPEPPPDPVPAVGLIPPPATLD